MPSARSPPRPITRRARWSRASPSCAGRTASGHAMSTSFSMARPRQRTRCSSIAARGPAGRPMKASAIVHIGRHQRVRPHSIMQEPPGRPPAGQGRHWTVGIHKSRNLCFDSDLETFVGGSRGASQVAKKAMSKLRVKSAGCLARNATVGLGPLPARSGSYPQIVDAGDLLFFD